MTCCFTDSVATLGGVVMKFIPSKTLSKNTKLIGLNPFTEYQLIIIRHNNNEPFTPKI